MSAVEPYGPGQIVGAFSDLLYGLRQRRECIDLYSGYALESIEVGNADDAAYWARAVASVASAPVIGETWRRKPQHAD